jgi:hypothetical protein
VARPASAGSESNQATPWRLTVTAGPVVMTTIIGAGAPALTNFQAVARSAATLLDAGMVFNLRREAEENSATT